MTIGKSPPQGLSLAATPRDIALLAEVDEAYGQLSGPATMEVLRRHYEVHGDERFQRLASISNIPLLEALITAFPVTVEACHADNGSEYINHRVAELLTKLHIGTFTKSRARRSNDNALVESRNGSVVRKWLGHIYVPAPLAPRVNAFLRDTLPLSSTSTGRACCSSTSQAPPAVLSESAIPRPGSLYPVQPVAQLDRCQGFPQARPAATSEALDQSALTSSPSQPRASRRPRMSSSPATSSCAPSHKRAAAPPSGPRSSGPSHRPGSPVANLHFFRHSNLRNDRLKHRARLPQIFFPTLPVTRSGIPPPPGRLPSDDLPRFAWAPVTASGPHRAGGGSPLSLSSRPRSVIGHLRWFRILGQVVKVDSNAEEEAPRWQEEAAVHV